MPNFINLPRYRQHKACHGQCAPASAIICGQLRPRAGRHHRRHAAGQEGRRLRGADLGRARYRQVAHCADYCGTARRRATHAVTLFLLAAPPGQRALSKHLPSSSVRQACGARIRPSSGSPSWRQSWPKGPMISEAQGEDASRPIGAARGSGGASKRKYRPASKLSVAQ
jgi:hypothetical protein